MVNKFENNVTIFYYSGTGNSLYVAKKILENFQDARLVSIPTISDSIIECNSEKIGFVFPINGKFLPPIVFNFMQNLNMTNPSYIFAIATYGMFLGKAMPIFNSIILNKGYKLDYGKKIKMPANCVISYPIRRNTINILKKAEEKIHKVCEDLKQQKKSVIRKNISLNEKHYLFVSAKRKKYLHLTITFNF